MSTDAPNNTSCRPALRKAVAFLTRLLAVNSRSRSSRLPSASVLALKAGVSRVTMLDALQVLKNAGALSLSPRTGAIIVDASAELPTSMRSVHSDARGPVWRIVSRRIQEDILAGKLRPGALPDVKQLIVRYGACYRTIHKARTYLADQGIITYRSKKFIIPEAGGYRPDSSILLIARGANPRGEPMLLSSQTAMLLESLEEECRNSRLKLDICTLYYEGYELLWSSPPLPRIRQSQRPYLGVIVWTQGLTRPKVVEICNTLQNQTSLPAAILDELGLVPGDLEQLTKGRISVYSFASSQECAFDIGRFLGQLGHRKVLFVSGDHEHGWSVTRENGLRSVLSRFKGASVDRVTVKSVEYGRSIDDGENPRKVFTPDAFTGSDNVPVKTSVTYSLVNPSMQIESTLRRIYLRTALFPLLEKAMNPNPYTAIVAANDTTALVCLDFLSEKGIPVPREVSVIGFDDTIEAKACRLTSYSFNEPRVIRTMLSHLLHPSSIHSVPAGSEARNISGMIIERATTGPAAPGK